MSTDFINDRESDYPSEHAGIEVYFSKTREFEDYIPFLNKIISDEEMSRASRFRFDEDRNTYVASHALLRLTLARKLGVALPDIRFSLDTHMKPVLEERRLYFNLSHTRDAFSFAVSFADDIGIDIEPVTRNMDFSSLKKNYFSDVDQKYLASLEDVSSYGFLLLWTRKEALLKALGVGMITDLKSYTVADDSYDKEGLVRGKWIKSENYYIFSRELDDHILSLACREQRDIKLKMFDFNDFEVLMGQSR